MNQSEIYAELITAIRQRAKSRVENGNPTGHVDPTDDAELFKALSRLIEGRSVYEAFGSPGSWGYESPIGKALKAAYSRPGSNPNRATVN